MAAVILIRAIAMVTQIQYLHSAYQVPLKEGEFSWNQLIILNNPNFPSQQLQALVSRRMFINASNDLQFGNARSW